MEKKKNKRKWREIRSAITMMCVMAAMLSTATFAWFTLTDSPTVTGLEMRAVSTGGLEVSWKQAESFSSAISVADETAAAGTNFNYTAKAPLELRPVTVASDGFALPQYSGGAVGGLQTGKTAAQDLQGVVAVYTFYIKSQAGTVDVGIIAGNSTQANKTDVQNSVASASGTFARSKTSTDGKTDNATMDASNALRIGLVVSENGNTGSITDMKVIEPNCNKSNEGNSAEDNRSSKNTAISHVKLNVDGTIAASTDDGYIGATEGDNTVSGKLFEATEAAKEVTMYIWIEGTDADCVDEIKLDEIVAQIQFTSLGTTAGTTTS